jgi:hypothetical protein
MQVSGTPTFVLGVLQPGDRVKLVRRAAGNTAEALGADLDQFLKQLNEES